MSYRITCYCSACNGNNTKTKSQETATAGVTVAVHRSKYSKNKEIYIEGIGSRKIQDIHGNDEDVIDVYVGDCSTCKCSSHPYSGKECEVSGI